MVSSEFYIQNRYRLVKNINGAVTVMTAYSQMQRGNDASFQFEQEANFWYLTGIESPDWWVIIDGAKSKTWLVSPSVDVTHQLFDGSLSAESALATSGADGVLGQDEALTMLKELANDHDAVYAIDDSPHVEHYDFIVNPAQKKLWYTLGQIFGEVKDCRPVLAKLRAVKQPAEIASMKKAIQLSVEAFENVKKRLPLLQYEYEVEAEFSYYFRKNGANGHAYDPIVASGHHACTLHYVENSAKLEDGQLLLLDIGAQVDGYAADISRTYTIGKPTERQVAVHAAVQKAHVQIIASLRPGLALQAYHKHVDETMKEALRGLDLLSSESDYRRYFPHAISHGLGIDVHDSLGGPEVFQPGMVLTVEPGIYIPEEGIGVRIEDDILITTTGHENLSAGLPISL